MSPDSSSNLDAQQTETLAGFELPPDFSLPALAEIEQIVALGDRSWTSLLGIDLPGAERRSTHQTSSSDSARGERMTK